MEGERLALAERILTSEPPALRGLAQTWKLEEGEGMEGAGAESLPVSFASASESMSIAAPLAHGRSGCPLCARVLGFRFPGFRVTAGTPTRNPRLGQTACDLIRG